MGRRILFVHGLHPSVSARDLAYEFERCGDIVRCDIPPSRGRSDSVYAFVEFYESRDAERAYYDLHGRPFMGGTLKIQWAKSAPRKNRRDSRSRSPQRSSHGDRRRSMSPRRRSNSPRGRSRSRSRSASPPRRSPSRSASPRRFEEPQETQGYQDDENRQEEKRGVEDEWVHVSAQDVPQEEQDSSQEQSEITANDN